MYKSTRSEERLTASQAILKGLASDGGLFLPETLEKLNIDASFINKDYKEMAKEVFRLFLDDFTSEEIDYCVSSAYDKINFREKFVELKHFDNVSFLELYHGPTLAFKDMALTVLPFLIEVSKKKNNVTDKSLILVATSGDTGGAALSSFMKSGEFDTVVLYPDGGVSEIQEKQMLYYTDDRTKAYAVKGNFDDCQTFVKEVFSTYNEKGVLLSSANSINIGRLVPQVIYYVYSYAKMVKHGELKMGQAFNVCVPTGNFGDIFAAFLAREIGVPINTFICASNKNNVLTDFFTKGVYDKNRQFVKSNSPAMDILVSSNLERLLYYAVGKSGEKVSKLMGLLKTQGKYTLNDEERSSLSCFMAGYSTEEETEKAIKRCFDNLGYLIDPHTAVAYDVYEKLNIKEKTLIVSTASPYKFPFTVSRALEIGGEETGEVKLIHEIARASKQVIPYGIKKLMYSKKPTQIKTREEIKDIVTYKNLKVEVTVPCSVANLGVGFDSVGMALNLYNTFSFEKAEKDELIGFGNTNTQNNLVLNAYKKLFELSGREYVPVKIKSVKSAVPSSSGLGSSATCIVAGVLGANYMLKNAFRSDYLLSVMNKIEGHPDNVAPAYLGGLVASVVNGDKVIANKLEVNKNLKIYAIIPKQHLSTKVARELLPELYSLKDVVHNVSRATVLPLAFSTGNVELIKEVFNDKLHQPYRLPQIEGGEALIKTLNELGYASVISGAGPTILAIGKSSGLEYKLLSSLSGANFKVKSLKVCDKGATLK
ncbi:MAG: threonine synthase [Clostridia bacterium]|nr:threonine synthase [Clostridia bacterium]